MVLKRKGSIPRPLIYCSLRFIVNKRICWISFNFHRFQVSHLGLSLENIHVDYMTSFKFCLPYFLGYYLYYSHFLEVYRGSRRFPFLSPGSLLFTYSHRSASFKGVDILFADRVPGSVISTAIDLGCCGPFRFPFLVLRQVQEGMVVLVQIHSLQVYAWFL